jgi:hypothetical protein
MKTAPRDRCGHVLAVVGRQGGPASLGGDLQSHVAALLGPLIGLFHQHRADQPDDGVTVGEDADYVGAPTDLPVGSLLRVVRPDLPPDLAREGGEGQQVGLSGSQVVEGQANGDAGA